MMADVASTFSSVCAQQVLSPKFDDARNAVFARDSGNDLAVRPNGLRRSVDVLAHSAECLFATLVEERIGMTSSVVVPGLVPGIDIFL
jgi:hypothetical protein